MRHTELSARLSVLCVFLFSPGLRGSDLYVSPTGIVLGTGTMEAPYDLKSALTGLVGQPGDTFLLRGGTYVIGHINTRIAGAPGLPITFREVPGEKARIDGSLTFFESAGYLVFMDFELYSSDTNRLSAQTGVGFDPTDIQPVIGISCHSPNLSFINLVVHDHTRHGLYIGEGATNTLMYGCLVYNNGWASPDNAEGHSFYVQGDRGTRDLADNLAFNASGANYHIYDNAIGRVLRGITLDGNVAFNAGALQAVRPYRDWVVGADPPAILADGIVLKHNMGYVPSRQGGTAQDQVLIGRFGTNGSVALLNNYLPLGLWMNNWTNAEVSGNLFAALTTNPIVQLIQTQATLTATWEDNSYSRSESGRDFQFNAIEYGFADWKTATGYDGNSTYAVGSLSGTKVFVRPNRYEAGRAHIIVYNWDNLSNVTVDVSSVLAPGAAYEVRNAQDFLAPPVLRGVFDGEPLPLPMTGLTVAAPNGPLLTPPPTGPTFNVFVLLPCRSRLGIKESTGAIEIYWPTNCGAYVLQFRDSLSDTSVWTDMNAEPVVRGDQYVVTNSVAETMKFYRLRSQ